MSPADTSKSSDAPSDAGRGEAGLYVYCVLAAGRTVPAGCPGVRLVEADGLSAFGEEIRLEELALPGPDAESDEIDWLEARVRAHEGILARALADGPVLPLRFGTVLRDDEELTSLLSRNRAALVERLERLAGRREWILKAFVEHGKAGEAAVPEVEEPLGEGAAYLRRKQAERTRSREEAQRLSALAEEAHATVAGLSAEAVLNAPHQGDPDREMILNAAYLVDESREQELRGAVERLRSRHGSLGADYELTGPWPPYDFSGVELE